MVYALFSSSSSLDNDLGNENSSGAFIFNTLGIGTKELLTIHPLRKPQKSNKCHLQ